MSELAGRVVLVVGATGGLGSRIASELETAGARVVRTSRSGSADAPPLDLLDGGSINAVISQLGALDGVVIAAGVVAFGPADHVADAIIDELFGVNTLGPIRLIRAVTPLLVASAAASREPFIVTLSGIVAESPTAGLAAYSSSKAALAAFGSAATRELRRSGIRLMDARPGHTETGLAGHPIAGTAPAFPPGMDPTAVARRIVAGITSDEKDLPSSAFA